MKTVPTVRTVRVLQHVAVEGPGRIGTFLEDRGARLEVTRIDRGDETGERLTDGLVVMGGPMSVYESAELPHLLDEQRLIERAIATGIPVLGVCLGAQLIAATLGARVYPGSQKEIGWHPVTLRAEARSDVLFRGAPEVFTPLHWHGDIFDLPGGAVPLARSEQTEHQAFRFGSAHALLFHLEATALQVETMASVFAKELEAAHIDGAALLASTRAALSDVDGAAESVLGAFADSVIQKRS